VLRGSNEIGGQELLDGNADDARELGQDVGARWFVALLPVGNLWLDLADNPGSEVELPLADKRLPEVLTVAEVDRVINQPDVTMALGVRDRAAHETLYSTGMRRMELCGLGVRDVDLEQGLVRIRRGKGRKDRVIPIGARAAMWIRNYLDDVRRALVVDESEPALLLTRFGHPLSLSH
jgi:integrase/recombinase XerD